MRRLLLLVSVGLFGVAVAVLPGLATATNQQVTASNFRYTPMQVAITPGGSVDFANNNGGNHDVAFTGPLPASCTGSTANIGPSVADSTAPTTAATWSGTCTFTQAGTYTFECTLHHFTGTVYVNAAGTVPTTTTGTTTTTTTTTTTPPPGGGGGGGGGAGSGGTGGAGGVGTGGGGATTPAPGAATASALTASASQRGTSVRGSVDVASGGSDFEADLFGTTSQIARSVLAGRSVKHGVAAGKLSFKVSLNRRARAALRRHHRLALKLVTKVTGAGGASTSLSKSITVRG